MRRGILGLFLMFVIGCLASLCLPTPHAKASIGINPTLSFEGKVVNSDGTNIPDGTYNMEFKIYQDGNSSGSGSTLKWSEDYLVGGTPVTITDGVFVVNLGSMTSFGGSIDWNQSVLWLSMQLGNTSSCTITTNFTSNCSGDGEMTPFIRLTASPYALNADRLDGLDSAAFAQLDQGQTWTGANVMQPTTNATGLLVKQTSAGSPTADIFNVQTANSTNVIQITGPAVNEAAVTIQSVGATRGLTLQSGNGTISFGSTTALTAGGAISLSSGGTTQTVSIVTPDSTTAATGAITIRSGNATVGSNLAAGTISIDTGTPTGSGTAQINIGTTNAKGVAIGNSTGATATSVAAGTGGLSLTTQGTSALNIGANAVAQTVNIGNGSGATTVVINCGTGACSLGANATAHTTTLGSLTGAAATTINCGTGACNIGASATAHTTTLGSLTGGSVTTLDCGTGGCNIGTTANAHATTVGSTNSTSNVAIQSGTGNIGLTTNGSTSTAFVKSGVNSATAFQVQNTSNNGLLTVDTQNNLTILGKASTIAGALSFNNATNSNTATIQSGVTSSSYALTLPTALPGSTQCLASSAAGVLSFTACAGGSSTLATVYTNGSSQTDSTIVLDSTRLGLIVQDASSPISGNLFAVQNNAGGNNYFSVDASSVGVRQASSTTAFVVKNGSGNSVFGVDTSGNQAVLGASSLVDGKLVFKNATNGNAVTLVSGATTSSYSLTLPTTFGSTNDCLQLGGGTQLQFGACGTSTGLAKNATDSSSASVSAAAFLYQLANTNTGVASGVMQLNNGSNVGSALKVLATANPDTNEALIYAKNSNATPSGNLLDLQNVNSSVFSVGAKGNVTINTNDSSIVRTSSDDFASGTIGSGLTNVTNPSGQLELGDGTVPNSGKGTITTSSQPAVGTNIGAGASAVSRPDGTYLIIKGGSALTTSVYDSVAGTITNSQNLVVGAGTVGVGSVVLPRPGGMYVVVMANGVVNTSNLDPGGTVTSTAGPSLTAAAGAGTVSYKRPDGKFLVTLGAGAGTTNVYDPIANTFAAGPTNSGGVTWGAGSLVLPRPDGTALFITGGSTSTTQIYNPSTANPSIGAFSGVGPKLDGAKASGTCGINGAGSVALKLANGKYVVLSKANVQTIYDPISNTFTCSNTGPATALGDGAHAIPLQNGKFLVIVGGGSTNSYVYDPSANSYTSQGTSLTAITTGAFSLMRADGTWQIITGTNTCTNGCTNNYDTGLPMNGSGAKFVSDDIDTSSLNASTRLRWTTNSANFSGLNGSPNTAFGGVQFFVRTATGGTCSTALNAVSDVEIANSGDFVQPETTDNCIRVTAQFNRQIPRKLLDYRGSWTGNNSTVQTMNYAKPALYDFTIDNSTVVHKDNFAFSAANSQSPTNSTIPTAPTSAAPNSTGSCTSGTHYWFVSFVTNGSESRLSPASTVQTCSGSNLEPLSGLPLGPVGTTDRKIYRTVAGALSTDTPYLVTTINNNSATTYNDGVADASLGAAHSFGNTSGPSALNIKAVDGQLTLPAGSITPTTAVGTTEYYLGSISGAHPPLPSGTQPQTGVGTFVMARPNKTFVVVAALTSPAANASIYDPASQTYTAQSSTSVPTTANGAGGFALKRPDGNYLVVLGNTNTTTNIYDANSNTFSVGPALTANTGIGASAIANTDGTYTIVHGAGATTSTIYDPVRNTMTVGPTLTTASNCGFWAIPLTNGRVKAFPGVASGATGATTSMNYNPDTKTFTAGTALAAAAGCGSTVFQRPDGFWVMVGGAAGTTGATSTNGAIINPVDGTGGALVLNNAVGQGATVVPRADGTFLILSGGNQTTSNIYIPYGGGTTLLGGANSGSYGAGPAATTAVGAGAVSFQRPDGKWTIINGNSVGTNMLADTGWLADGQYISEQMQVPALAANSKLNWTQTTGSKIRMEAKYASTQDALATTPFTTVSNPAGSIGNSGGETWVQVAVDFRRDFPTFGYTANGVYNSSGGKIATYRSIVTPTLISYDISNGNDLLTLQNDGLNVLRISSSGNIYSSSDGGFYSGGADLAENYNSSEDLTPGDLVTIDPGNNQGVKRSSGQYQSSLLGVVSTAPGFVAGSYTDTSVPVALAGRVPVKISTENGAINSGDFLTSSSIPGYAMKATQSGRVIGTALESFDPATAKDCPSEGLGNDPDTKCGTVTMFVNLTDYQGASVEAMMAQDETGLTYGDASIPNVNFTEVNGLTGGNQEQILGFLSNMKAKEASGQAPKGSSIFTGSVNAVNQVISPLIVADTIRAKTIQADRIEGLEIYTGQISSLTDLVNGLANQSSAEGDGNTGTSTSITPTKVDFASGQFTTSLVSLGILEARGGLVVDGDSQFNGRTTFNGLALFMSNASFKGSISADGRVTFNNDTGGLATIPKGSSRVDIKFNNEYANQPVVAATLYANASKQADGSTEDIRLKEQRLFSTGYTYIISNLTTKGFTIVLSKQAAENIQFNWNALSINGATNTEGLPDPTY